MQRRQFLKTAGMVAVAPATTACAPRLVEPIPHPTIAPSKFGKQSSAEQVTEGLDLSGRLAVVTGCNSGIGLETMRVLALRGAHVVGTGRTMEKAKTACESIAGKTTPVAVELSDLDSVAAGADRINALGQPIDMLILNAGLGVTTEHKKIRGLEQTFAINHLGHFVLANRLLPRVLSAPQGRVVTVSSFAVLRMDSMEITFDNLSHDGIWSGGHAYAHSKLANALFSLHLSQRLANSNATSNALHPGVIGTNISRNVPKLAQWAFTAYADLMHKNIAQGAATSCYVATAPELKQISGQFFSDCNAVGFERPHNMDNQAMAKRLWDVSEQLAKGYII